MLSASELSRWRRLEEEGWEVTARRKSVSEAFVLGFRFCAFCAGLGFAFPVDAALFGVAAFFLDFQRLGISGPAVLLPPISTSTLPSLGDVAAELGAVVGWERNACGCPCP